MKTMVQRWGNGLALRIPKALAEEILVREGDEVEMNIAKGRLVVAPLLPGDYRLADLVAGIRPDNQHAAIVTGEPQGKEAW